MVDVTERVISDILNGMIPILNKEQLNKLKQVLYMNLSTVKIEKDPKSEEIVLYDIRNMKILNEFIKTKLVEGKSERTLNAYRYHIKNMLDHINKYVGNINTRDIRQYLMYYKEIRNIKNSTLQNILSAIQSFFNWLEEEDYILKSPTRKIKKIKVDKEVKLPFSEEDLLKIKEAAMKTRNGLRDIALVEFLNTTGCRVSEVAALNIEDINWAEKTCIVFGKGSKYREVFLNEAAIFYLKRYLNICKEPRTSGPVFLSKSGKRIRKDDIERNLRNIATACGVANVHPHRFRRTLACRLMNRGVPVQEIMVILGHSNINTTMIYCNVSNDSVKMSHKKYA